MSLAHSRTVTLVKLRRALAHGLLLAALATCFAAPARAAITAPALEVIAVQATRAPSGVFVRVDGSFPQGDLVQQRLEIQVLFWTPETGAFTRFDLPVGAFEGNTPLLQDDFAAGEIDALVAASSRTRRPRMLLLAPGRIEVLLPASFAAGEARVQLYLIYRGEPILSNPVQFEIPVVTP